MENYKLIQPCHLNHYGFLFGGNMLKWVDEYGYIAACSDFPSERFVTIAMNDIQFKNRVLSGEVLRFCSERKSVGKTSVSYGLVVTRDLGKRKIEVLFETQITYVCVDEYGEKKKIDVIN